MVRVEDITKDVIEELKEEALYENDMRTAFGKGIEAESIGCSIYLRDKEKGLIGRLIDGLGLSRSVFILENPSYLEQAKRFGEIYELRMKKDLTIKLDYSKLNL